MKNEKRKISKVTLIFIHSFPFFNKIEYFCNRINDKQVNYEELIESRDKRKTGKFRLPYGYFYKRIIDNKYSNFVEFHDELTDNILFSECIRRQCDALKTIKSKYQLHFTPNEGGDDDSVYAVAIEPGNYISFEQLLNDNPAIVVKDDFINATIRNLVEITTELNSLGIQHLCFAPSNILVRKSDNEVRLLLHGSFFLPTKMQDTFFEDIEGFIAPEVMSEAQCSDRSDVYSLGKLIAFLYEQGSMPFEYKQVVKKATAEEPRKRYKSLDEMHKAISQKRSMRRSAVLMAASLIVSLLAVYIYVDTLPDAANNIEFVEPAKQQTNDLFSSDELEEDTAFLADTIDLSDEALMQKAEMIYRKRYQKAADEILSKVYNSKHMGSSEKTFMANSQSMAEELLKVQKELAGEAGLPDGLAGRIGHEIVEQLTQQKQKGLSRHGYIKAKENDNK